MMLKIIFNSSRIVIEYLWWIGIFTIVYRAHAFRKRGFYYF